MQTVALAVLILCLVLSVLALFGGIVCFIDPETVLDLLGVEEPLWEWEQGGYEEDVSDMETLGVGLMAGGGSILILSIIGLIGLDRERKKG